MNSLEVLELPRSSWTGLEALHYEVCTIVFSENNSWSKQCTVFSTKVFVDAGEEVSADELGNSVMSGCYLHSYEW